jgi:propionyl-CoA synthetase
MSTGAYSTAYAASLANPTAFWGEAAKDIGWITPPTTVLDDSRPPFYRWFPDGTLNTCFNAIDRHVAGGRADQVAIHYDSPVTGRKDSFTYAELLAHVSRLAGALVGAGVGKGDRVLVYMPMVPEAVFAMLACARIGAIHSVVFGGFAPAEVAARIDDAKPKLILSASCGIEPNRVVPYKPFLDEGIARIRAQARPGRRPAA